MPTAITQRLCPLSTPVHAAHQEKVRIGIFDNVWGKIDRSVYEFISNPTVLYFFSADVHSAFLCGAKVVLTRQVLQAHVLPDKCVPEVLTHELNMGPVYRCSALSDIRSSKVLRSNLYFFFWFVSYCTDCCLTHLRFLSDQCFCQIFLPIVHPNG